MEKTTGRAWIAVGLAVLVVATLVMGWFAGRFVPGEPMPIPQDTVSNANPSDVDTGVVAAREVDVAAGNALVVEEVTQGYQYTYPLEEAMESAAAAGAPEGGTALQKALQASRWWHVDYGAFELSVGETKVMSGTSFKEWYPDAFVPDTSEEPRYRGSELPGKAFLVTVHAKNLSATESLELPEFTLWSDDLNCVSDAMGAGAYPSVLLKSVLYANSDWSEEPDEGTFYGGAGNGYNAPGNEWLTLAPGEERDIVVPYYVYRNSFTDDEAFESVDLSKFCLEVNDYDPGVRYRFWLDGSV